nr:cytochrome b6-f complex subunit VII [Cavernulicola chilensis]
MGNEITTIAATCCILVLIGLSLGFALLKVQEK